MNGSTQLNAFEMALCSIDLACQGEDHTFSMWSVIDGIVGVPYWERLWIVQEIALGSSLLFWYGDYYVTPSELSVVSSSLPRQEGPTGKLIQYVGKDKSMATIFNLYPAINMPMWLRKNIHGVLLGDERQEHMLVRCITQATHSHATDLRDKVYGLLALLPPAISSQIHPSYDPDVTWRDTWIMFAKSCFQHNESLNLLSRLNRNGWPTHPDIPTWAMNLHKIQRQMFPLPEQLNSHEPGGSYPGMPFGHLVSHPHVLADLGPFASDAEFDPAFKFSKDNLLLSCEGVFVDRVGNMATLRSTRQRIADPSRYMTAMEPIAGYRKACPDPKLSLARAVVGNSRFQWGDDASLFDIPWLSSRELQKVPITAYDHRGGPNFRDSSRFHKSTVSSCRMLQTRRIFETQDGLVGCVTSSALPGDRIAILFGCDMPVVLRPTNGEYEVIGGCFVDGLMNGEVAEEVKNGDLVPETITLC
ncbi:hypothetical protein PG994_009626 [Apiospora phragmitis]|uniref:Heterokaryon incompatibility domain-containing protein n=1 Tax=Apiospora phragmitis TaxID=2905665 RepID=A0ABR1U9E4_9PEZI